MLVSMTIASSSLIMKVTLASTPNPTGSVRIAAKTPSAIFWISKSPPEITDVLLYATDAGPVTAADSECGKAKPTLAATDEAAEHARNLLRDTPDFFMIPPSQKQRSLTLK